MKGFLKALMWLAIIGGIAFLIGWLFLFKAHTSTDHTMAPNLVRGDSYLVYTRTRFHRGAPALCEHPQEPGVKVVGRIIAMGGDRVAVRRGGVYLNDELLQATDEGEYVLVDEEDDESAPTTSQLKLSYEIAGMNRYKTLLPAGGRVRDMRELEVPEGDFFLMADNRSTVNDSRSYGTVRASGCVGRPLFIYSPGPSAGDADRVRRWFNFVR